MADVAYCRELSRGNGGGDVTAHKRGLSRMHPVVYPWRAFTPFFGGEFEDAVKWLQRNRGLPANGVIDQRLHTLMENAKAKNKPGEPAFDAYAAKLAEDFCDNFQTPEQRMREAIIAAGLFWYSHRSSIAYRQTRPFQQGKPPWVPSAWDCSAFVTVCHYAGGAPDPNGRGYDQQGYTGTLMTRGARVGSISSLEPGDLIFYGFSASRPGFNAGDPTHVALYVGVRDGAPMVLSHGSYPMKYLHFDYRRINHLRHYPMGV